MTVLIIRFSAMAVASDVQSWLALPCSFTVTGDGDDIVCEGSAPLAALAGDMVAARRVVILLAASDVTLLRIKMPPLSASRLKQALPHLVEDQLISDPAECVMVAGEAEDGMRTVAITQRTWLAALANALRDIGARNVIALPAQLCLRFQPDSLHAAAFGDAGAVDLALRMSMHEAIGLSIFSKQPDLAAIDVMEMLQALSPQGTIVLHVMPAHMQTYKEALTKLPHLATRLTLVDDDWQYWIAGIPNASLNLLAGMHADLQRKIEWRTWRWPLTLGACLLFLNIAGLNIEWWRAQSEAQRLRVGMTETYRWAYPGEKVIVDPLLQMQQKVAAARRLSGQVAADDFIALAAELGAALKSAAPPANANSIASIEYRERNLFVKLKEDGADAIESIRSALAARNLSLSQSTADTWKIGRKEK